MEFYIVYRISYVYLAQGRYQYQVWGSQEITNFTLKVSNQTGTEQ